MLFVSLKYVSTIEELIWTMPDWLPLWRSLARGTFTGTGLTRVGYSFQANNHSVLFFVYPVRLLNRNIGVIIDLHF